MFSAKYKYKTKQAHNGILRHTRDLGLEINQDSFRWRAAKSYNELPLEIRDIPKLEGSKKGVKTDDLHHLRGTSLPPPPFLRVEI